MIFNKILCYKIRAHWGFATWFKLRLRAIWSKLEFEMRASEQNQGIILTIFKFDFIRSCLLYLVSVAELCVGSAPPYQLKIV
jgi:hypothetical protein